MANPDVGVSKVAYQFLPWVRRGLAVALSNADTLGAMPSRAVASVGVKLAAPLQANNFAPISMQLYGPGDVIGIDTSLIVRTDPKANSHNFEPNYLALIDFDPPDFPWLLTPAKNNDKDQLRPWLVLVVLEVQKTGLPRMQPQANMPSIRIKAGDVKAELPDLADSWSWAHAQVVSSAAESVGLQSDLQSRPQTNVSRLICPRRLSESTNYVACLVPAFEPGRLRGLGIANDQDPAMQSVAPAWNKQAVADVVLPVYHWWEFSTSVSGDFESLARRLKTPSAYRGTPLATSLGKVGTSPMSVDSVLNGIQAVPLETMEGALVPIKYEPGSKPNDTQAQSLRAIINTPAGQTANPVTDAGLNHEGARLEVKPQVLGGWHAKQQSVQTNEQGKHWLADLNMSPRYRGAAGYGAEVVRKNQDDYVDAAWDQIGSILEAERRMNMTRLAIEVQLALKLKHLDKLPAERLLQVMGPALPRIEALSPTDAAYRINGQLASLGGQMERSSLPAALMGTGMRRVTSPQRRTLRMAARMQGSSTELPGVMQRYVGVMAAATTKTAAFDVNAFMPDGIVGTKLLDGVNLDAATLDLSRLNLGSKVSAALVRTMLKSGRTALGQLTKTGSPALHIKVGQSQGVFTDAHVERFGALASAAPQIRGSDWGVIAGAVEALGKRGVEGLLIEAGTAKNTLQFSTMRLDARNGQLRLDRALLRLDPTRTSVKPIAADTQRALATVTGVNVGANAGVSAGVNVGVNAGVNLGKVNLTDARQFNNATLFASLPVNALQTDPKVVPSTFALNAGFQFVQTGSAAVSNIVSDIVTVTLPPATRKREVLIRFAVATRGTQALMRDGFAASLVDVRPVDFAVSAAAAVVRIRSNPSATLAARLQSLVSVAGSSVASNNFFVGQYLAADDFAAQQVFMMPALFDRVMAWPKLLEPMYQALARHDKQAFMPGVDGIPEDTIMLVKVNQFFIDSFMVGANHEMNRELLWRGFPTDLRGTPFQRFWGRLTVNPGQPNTTVDDMQPIHQWGKQALGKRLDSNFPPLPTQPGEPPPQRVALLVKGQLLRRYPNTAVYAWRRVSPKPEPGSPESKKSQLQKNGDGSAVDGAIKTPIFAGFIDPDVTFFGFDIAQAEIKDWCFVLEEQMSEPRFGFDVGDPFPGQRGLKRDMLRDTQRDIQRALNPSFGVQPRTALTEHLAMLAPLAATDPIKQKYNPWKAMSWDHVGVNAGAYVSVTDLKAVNLPGFVAFPKLEDGTTAAHIAKALIQTPFRAYYVGDDLAP